jgi:drug/metabolite transporter (DMT)-like permease
MAAPSEPRAAARDVVSSAVAASRDDVPRAVLYMGYTALLIPILNAAAKYLVGEGYSTIEVTWARYAGHFFWMLIAFAPRRGIRLLVTAEPVLQLLRSTLLFASTMIYFTALGYLSLPTAAAIGFTGPFIVVALAPLVLGEAVGAARWVAVGLGFLGALVIVRPGLDGFQWASLLVFGSATTSALYQLVTRKLASRDPAETSITYIALAGFLLASLMLPFYWRSPQSWSDALLLASLGIFGGFGHYFMVRAYELAPAPVVTPFNYGQLLGAALLSYTMFGQVPDAMTWLGAAIIVASGLHMIYRERRRGRAARED